MKKVLSFLLICSFSLQAKEVKFIKKGEVAPYDGYIFDLEAEESNQMQLIRKNRLEDQVVLYEKDYKLMLDNSELWKKVATENTERLLKVQDNTFWQNTLFFGLGVVLTGALAIGLSKGVN